MTVAFATENLKMKNTIHTSEDLVVLRNNKSELCISLILPLAKLNPAREQNDLVLKKAIQRIQLQGAEVFSQFDLSPYLQKINSLYSQIDPVHPPEGVGFWVSDKTALLKTLPYTPAENIFLGKRFAIREIIQLAQLERPFLVLLLTETSAELFKGIGQQLTKINVPALTHEFDDHYEYSPPSRSSSFAGHAHVKSFERDEELLQQERNNKHNKNIDNILRQFSDPNSLVLVIGESRLTNAFCKKSTLPPSQLTSIEKDPSHLSHSEISLLSQKSIQEQLKKIEQQKIDMLKNSVGSGRARIGLQACWRAAQEGNCSILLVEKNFYHPGFLAEDPYYLFLKPPTQAHQIITDAVDELMELVIEKKGEVLLMEPGMLTTENNIALITRY